MPFLLLSSRTWRGRMVALSLAFGLVGAAVASAAYAQAPAALAPASATRDPQAIARSVEAVGFTVSDMDRAIDFYSSVLAFR